MHTHRASITPEQELALLLAGTASSRAARSERIQTLADYLDFGVLETLLREQGMLALIGQRLQDITTLEPSSHFCKQVKEYTVTARRQSLHQQMLSIRLMAALEEEDIRVLPLKGPLLGERLYGDIGARVSADIDLLVSEADLSRAVDVVVGFGYERHRYATSHSSTRRPALHECLGHQSGFHEVEVHWRIHWYETRFSADLLARSAPGQDGYLRPSLSDELIQLLLLYARDGFSGLRLVADIGAWWDRYGAELNRCKLIETASEYPAVERSLATAALLAERLVGLPARELFPARVLSHASRKAMRLANWPPRGDSGQINANISLVDRALSPTGQSRALVRRHLLLTDEDLCSRWPDTGSSSLSLLWLRTGLRTIHALGVLGHCAITLWVLAIHRAWAPLPRSLIDAASASSSPGSPPGERQP
jgi:Uncharacterised nucleotidyltransferase